MIQPGETLSVSTTPLIRTLLNILDWQLPEPGPNDEDKPPPKGDIHGPLVGSVKIGLSLDPEPLPLTVLGGLDDSPRDTFTVMWGRFHRIIEKLNSI